MPDRVGQQVGKYRLLRLLGRGGFADVYLGEHLHLKNQAAIKLLNTQLSGSEIDAFLKEAQIIARLEHPHIVRIFDFEVQDGIPFLVMSYASNGTLRDRYPKYTRLPMSSIVSYVKYIADALQYAHDEKVIHRDIKPENMLLGRRDEIMLSDFGIAIVAQSSLYQSTKDIAGTMGYMAPEQIQAHPRPASDQYSLGVVVYEWISGQLPYQGTAIEVAAKHIYAPLPPLHEKLPGISPAVEEVVTTALAKEPQQRFSSIQAFARALEQASQERVSFPLPGQFIPQQPPPPPSPQTIPPARPTIQAERRPVESTQPAFLPPTTQGPYTIPPATTSNDWQQSFSPYPPTESRNSTFISRPQEGNAVRPAGSHTGLSRNKTALLVGLALLVIIAGSIGVFARNGLSNPGATTTPTSTSSTGGSVVVTSHPKASQDRQIFTSSAEAGVSDLTSFDPALVADTMSQSAVNNVFTGLVGLNDQLKVQCELCSTYSVGSDGVTWTFKLKPNLKFSDGTPLTSEDLVYSIDRALDPATQSAIAPYYLRYIKDAPRRSNGQIQTLIGDSLNVPDANTVVIIASQPAAFFLDTLTYPSSFVVEKSVVQRWGKSWTDHLADNGGQGGAGPWKVQEYTHSKQIIFVPNPNYYGPIPQMRELIYPFYKTTDIAYQAYQANQIDSAPIPTADFNQARTSADFHSSPSLAINYYTMNYLKKPFDVTACRQAFALAINKDLIVKSVWGNSNIATNHIVPQDEYGYNPNLKGPDGTTSTAGNSTAARADLQSCMRAQGYTSVAQFPPITLTFSSTGLQSVRNEVAEVQQMWQNALGINVRANDIDITKLFTDESLGSNNPLQFYTGPAWLADYPDPQDWTTLQFDKGASQNGMSFGQNNGSDAAAQRQLQQQMEQADTTADPVAREQAYWTIEQQLVNFVAWMPMEQQTISILQKPCLQNIVLNASGLTPPDDWSKIYISTDMPCATA